MKKIKTKNSNSSINGKSGNAIIIDDPLPVEKESSSTRLFKEVKKIAQYDQMQKTMINVAYLVRLMQAQISILKSENKDSTISKFTFDDLVTILNIAQELLQNQNLKEDK